MAQGTRQVFQVNQYEKKDRATEVSKKNRLNRATDGCIDWMVD